MVERMGEQFHNGEVGILRGREDIGNLLVEVFGRTSTPSSTHRG